MCYNDQNLSTVNTLDLNLPGMMMLCCRKALFQLKLL